MLHCSRWSIASEFMIKSSKSYSNLFIFIWIEFLSEYNQSYIKGSATKSMILADTWKIEKWNPISEQVLFQYISLNNVKSSVQWVGYHITFLSMWTTKSILEANDWFLWMKETRADQYLWSMKQVITLSIWKVFSTSEVDFSLISIQGRHN